MSGIEKHSSKYWKINAHALHAERNFGINWGRVQFGEHGSKHQRHYLLNSMKGYLDSYITDGNFDVIEGISPGTIVNAHMRQRTLVHWMIPQGLWRFSQLTQRDLLNFLQSRVENSKRGNLSEETINSYLYLFCSMWNLRENYPSSLRVDINEILEIGSAFKFTIPLHRWKPIDLEQAKALLNDAMKWMDSFSPTVIEMGKTLYEIRRKFVGKSHSYRTSLSRKTYLEIAKSEPYKLLLSKIGTVEEQTYHVLRRGIRTTLSAAITIILLLTGMRISELSALRRGCITKKILDDGHSYFYINGIAAKKNGREKAWIAPQPVVQAISIIEALLRGPLRTLTINFCSCRFLEMGLCQSIRLKFRE